MKFCLSGRVFESPEQTVLLQDFYALAAVSGFKAVELRKNQVSPDSPNKTIDLINCLSVAFGVPVELITMRGRTLDTDADFSFFEKYLELAVNINCSQVKVSGRNIKVLRKAAEKAEKFNIKIATNNHVSSPLETVAGTVAFLNAVGHPNFYLLFDPSHLWMNREEITGNFIREILPKISFVVIQDYVETATADFAVIGKRRVRPVSLLEAGEVGYSRIVKELATLNSDLSFGLVQPGAIRNVNEGEAWVASWPKVSKITAHSNND